MKRLLLLLAFLLLPNLAEAQVPGCPLPLQYGQVLTTAEWNACLSATANGLPLSGGKLTGELILAPSTSTSASLNLPPGTAPVSPLPGDIWMTSSGLFYNDGVGTYGPLLPGGTVGQVQTNNGTGGWAGINNTQLTALVNACTSSLSGAVPTPPNNTTDFLRGDCTWAVPPGSGGGTVTSITNSDGTITLSPSPITSTGSVSCTVATSSQVGCSKPDNATLVMSSSTIELNLSELNLWGAPQSEESCTLTPSSSTFTPNFQTCQTITLDLNSSCPCTLANPSSGPPASGHSQQGVMYFQQDSTGGRTIGTWGSDYESPSGTSANTLSTGANALDVGSYTTIDATHIIIAIGALNVSH